MPKGAATGAALAFAALGGRATLLSSLGTDPLAGLVRDDLERHRAKVVDQARGTTDVTVVLDAGSWKPVLTELLPLTTMAVCASAFRLPGGEPSSASLIEQGPEFVAVTDGPNAVRRCTRRRAGVVPVPTVTVRDSLGAGDTFHGAFAHALALGATPEDALRSAVEIASMRVTNVGPRSWMSDPRLTTTTPPGAAAR